MGEPPKASTPGWESPDGGAAKELTLAWAPVIVKSLNVTSRGVSPVDKMWNARSPRPLTSMLVNSDPAPMMVRFVRMSISPHALSSSGVSLALSRI